VGPRGAAVEDAFGTARVLDEYAGLATAVLARLLGQAVEVLA